VTDALALFEKEHALKNNPLIRTHRLALWLMVLVLLLGSGLRIVALEQSPPGLAPDEASNGYDAYSMWHTGRDQHGILLPTAFGALNDYRMPLFIYSVVPVVGLGGLSVLNIRLVAAWWGILTLPLVYWLGSRMFGRTVGLGAALFLALSPWQVPLNRIAHEGATTVLMALLAVGLTWRWYQAPQKRYIIGAAVAWGLALYTYSVMEMFALVMVAGLGFLFWRTTLAHWRQIALAAVIVAMLALPMIYNNLRWSDAMQARYRQIAVFQPGRPLGESLTKLARYAWLNLSPDFLFGRGDRDDLQHPPGMGQLYPIQALLVVMGVTWGLKHRSYRLSLAIIGLWILAATLPAALTEPNLPNSGHSLRSLPAVVPWQLLSGLGLVGLLQLPRQRWLQVLTVTLILGWVAGNAFSYFRYYFTRYPTDAANRFDVATRRMADTVLHLDNGYAVVYFATCRSSWIYLHLLFSSRYDPRRLQMDLPVRGDELFAPVTRVGKYHIICDAQTVWDQGEKGLYVVPEAELPGVTPLAVLPGPREKPFKIVSRP